MWRGLCREMLELISAPRCSVCGGEAVEAAAGADPGFCRECLAQLQLPEGGLQGDDPLLWCALAPYRGALRRLLLRQRPQPDRAVVAALATQLRHCCAEVLPGALLVPIPSWKRAANPLPALLAEALARAACDANPRAGTLVRPDLLRRSRPTLGQHHLSRALRLRNQQQAFACPAAMAPPGQRPRPLWIIDDILTTGATALAAARTLQEAGHAVQGLLSLARTPLAGPL